MTSLSRELVFLILQFLDEEKYKDTVHRLEQESGLYFNMRHFDEMVMNGDWNDLEKYLFGFTKVDDNRYSMKIFFEIRKQKYLEALDKKDRATAVEILVKDLRLFSTFNEDLIKEMTQLLALDNFRENEQLSRYTDAQHARSIMLLELKKLIEANPLFRDKLNFPSLKNSRLRTLINQSLNWQHQLCKVPKPNPDIRTLFVDHTCGTSQPNNCSRAPSPVPNPLMGVAPRPGGFSPLTAHGPFQPAPGAMPASLAGWMTSPPPYVSHPTPSAGPVTFNLQTANAGPLKHPRTPTNNLGLDYQSTDSEKVVKRSRTFTLPDEVNNAHVNAMAAGLSIQGHRQGSSFSFDDLPKTVIMNLNQGSKVRSMDFHPVQQSLLVVGTISGETMIWELLRRNRICHKSFKVWDLRACSMVLQTSLANDYSGSVNRVLWSPDGSLCAVAYSKHIIHLYSYHGADDLRNHLEIEAHVGSVNDLAFSVSNKLLCIITCGEDRLIKVWDTVSGSKQYTFEGHEAPVHSVCPHYKDYIQFIFGTATDGKIKAWLYDNQGSRVDYEAPGRSTTTMAYSADGKRLFSCGTNKEGNSHLVEWNESEGAVKRTYSGLCKRAEAIVQFDTTNNRILAVGDDFLIKFWDMDNVNLLATTDAEGGLHASSCVRFNKEGALLAVSTSENGIKILASADGGRLLRAIENTAFDASRLTSDNIVKPPSFSGAVNASTAGSTIVERVAPVSLVAMNAESRGFTDSKVRVADEPSVEKSEKSRTWKMTEVNDASQCRALRLSDNSTAMRVSNLTYTNSGFGILALASNAIHKLWKWPKNDKNLSGKASANVAPQLWQPPSGILMTNDISDANLENAVPCFALSKNDSYVMSASGGKVSLFNMMTFKTMTSFMAPPPAATFLTFHLKDNNIIAIGMDDSSIQIYNVRLDEVKVKLDGHQKRITGLAFSNALNVLVSSGADSQLCVWSTDSWEKQTSKYIQRPPGRVTAPVADTCVQFHQDQTHLLVVHETQIAIYEAPKLVCLKQWVPLEASGPITYATYSCDSESIYVSFEDGSVGVLTASTLRLRCRINPSSYIPANSSVKVYPLVVAAHPSEPNQFALGLSDGGVCVLEPLESEGRWGTLPPLDNVSVGPSNSTSDQQHHQR